MFRIISRLNSRCSDLILRKSHNPLIYLSAKLNQIGSDSAAYSGDGKTTVTVLNNNSNLNLVNTYSQEGFRLHNNLFIYGSILLFPTHVFSWNVKRSKDINLESLLLFDIIVPKVKIVIIGYGAPGDKCDDTLPIKLKKKGIGCELLSTPNAITTYNYLAADSVHVAGAFIPYGKEVNSTFKDSVELGSDLYVDDARSLLREKNFQNRVDDHHDSKLAWKTVGRESEKKKFD